MAKKKKKNPQDSTMRNVRAANKAIKKLAVRVVEIEERMHFLEKQFSFSAEGK